MARTVTEIKKEITDEWMAKPAIVAAYGLDMSKTFEQQFLKVSLESIKFYVFAFACWTVEKLFDTHLAKVDDMIRNKRVHTIGWYRTTALNFQFGGALKEDITEYDNTGLSEEDIEEQKIVKKCSVSVGSGAKPTLIVKVLKSDSKLSAVEKSAFQAYMENMTDAGIEIKTISTDADRIVLYITIRYDNMVMDETGTRFIDGKNPLKEGITEHLNNLEFNGNFYPSLLEQYLMKQNGIKVATIRVVQAAVTGELLQEITDKYEPYSGAVSIDFDNDLHVIYERF